MSDWGATQRVSARVVLAQGVVVAGELHLLARTTYPADSESPLEMLNRDDPFFALTLPDAADSAQITATFEHGVLRLEVPKSEASKPKRIALKSAD